MTSDQVDFPDYKTDDSGPSVTIQDSNFTGCNSDGSSAIIYEYDGDGFLRAKEIRLVGWTILGPLYVGRMSWRLRLACWLLGHKMSARP